eukprot:TRINITY_DN112584_c0_g1_i1.p1 TRINITY_DN112584_c0_g1~~TRINITY_DN112584_c0_g1_i1.p1  ORF type:complete len:398 (+),score=29.23 TRINITY_DN112584_c0_g1_i1:74-1267(+)
MLCLKFLVFLTMLMCCKGHRPIFLDLNVDYNCPKISNVSWKDRFYAMHQQARQVQPPNEKEESELKSKIISQNDDTCSMASCMVVEHQQYSEQFALLSDHGKALLSSLVAVSVHFPNAPLAAAGANGFFISKKDDSKYIMQASYHLSLQVDADRAHPKMHWVVLALVCVLFLAGVGGAVYFIKNKTDGQGNSGTRAYALTIFSLIVLVLFFVDKMWAPSSETRFTPKNTYYATHIVTQVTGKCEMLGGYRQQDFAFFECDIEFYGSDADAVTLLSPSSSAHPTKGTNLLRVAQFQNFPVSQFADIGCEQRHALFQHFQCGATYDKSVGALVLMGGLSQQTLCGSPVVDISNENGTFIGNYWGTNKGYLKTNYVCTPEYIQLYKKHVNNDRPPSCPAA